MVVVVILGILAVLIVPRVLGRSDEARQAAAKHDIVPWRSWAMRGFTLIELLLAVAIIGITAGIVSLSVRGADAGKLAEEGDRLAALFRMAASEARVGGRSLVWEADLAGYRFRPL